MNWDVFVNISRLLENLSTFDSSRGASISSRTQNGLGFTLNIANIRATAVRAFSPPERSETFWSLFPGGLAAISIPHSSTLPSSRSMSSPSPPPKSILKKFLNSIWIFLNVSIKSSFVVLFILLIASSMLSFAFNKSSLWVVKNTNLSWSSLFSSIATRFTAPIESNWLRISSTLFFRTTLSKACQSSASWNSKSSVL